MLSDFLGLFVDLLSFLIIFCVMLLSDKDRESVVVFLLLILRLGIMSVFVLGFYFLELDILSDKVLYLRFCRDFVFLVWICDILSKMFEMVKLLFVGWLLFILLIVELIEVILVILLLFLLI